MMNDSVNERKEACLFLGSENSAPSATARDFVKPRLNPGEER
jgi:hypothetical protein